MNKHFSKTVETIWNDLRPMTKRMLEGALTSGKRGAKQKFSYDAHADWELSNLLKALDEQVRDPKEKKDTGKLREIANLANICAGVLEAQTESAEVFIQLAKRVIARNDFDKLDKLTDVLFDRFSAGEIAEVIRQTEMAQIRAIAYETLAVLPTTLLVPLLEDPIYFDIACNALEQQAVEFESDEARKVLEHLGSEYDYEDDH